MSFAVFELSKAKADKRHIFEWLFDRSQSGAGAWLAAYDTMIERLTRSADSFAEAYENADLDFEHVVREAIFKTQHGQPYRVLFFVEDDSVYILRVRGPGQAPVDQEDL